MVFTEHATESYVHALKEGHFGWKTPVTWAPAAQGVLQDGVTRGC
jgi:hypothetical protein